MSECANLEMRDLLPDFARGALSGATSTALESHLAMCADCRAELRVVRDTSAMLRTMPSIDTSRIIAAIGRSSAIRRDATASVARARRRRAWSVASPSRRVWLAAASIAVIVTTAVLATNDDRSPVPRPASSVAQTEQAVVPAPVISEPPSVTPRPAPPVELVMGGGVSDLAEADLESLLRALDDVGTELDVEPAALLTVLEGDD
jgi:hypothetical protein